MRASGASGQHAVISLLHGQLVPEPHTGNDIGLLNRTLESPVQDTLPLEIGVGGPGGLTVVQEHSGKRVVIV